MWQHQGNPSLLLQALPVVEIGWDFAFGIILVMGKLCSILQSTPTPGYFSPLCLGPQRKSGKLAIGFWTQAKKCEISGLALM